MSQFPKLVGDRYPTSRIVIIIHEENYFVNDKLHEKAEVFQNFGFLCLIYNADRFNQGLVFCEDGTVIINHGRITADGIDYFHAGSDPAESGIFAIKAFQIHIRCFMNNEKLRGCRVMGHFSGDAVIGIFAEARHRDDTSDMHDGVMNAVCGKFTFDGLIGAAGAVTIRVTALDHETAHDAVEGDTVIETVFNKPQKIFNGFRSDGFVECEGNYAVILDGDFHLVKFVTCGVHFVRIYGVGGDIFAARTEKEGCEREQKEKRYNFFHNVF